MLRIMRCVDGSLFCQKIDGAKEVTKNAAHDSLCSLRMFSTFVRPSLNDLLQSCTWVLQTVSSSNCALSLVRILAGFTFSLVRNLRFATAERTTCSLIVIVADKKQVDTQTSLPHY
jgi:hypothetical protein